MLTAALLLVTLAFGGSYYDCVRDAVPMERALEVAKQYVGKPLKAWVGQSKRTGECFWKVNGTEGYIILKAESGEIIKFYRNKK